MQFKKVLSIFLVCWAFEIVAQTRVGIVDPKGSVSRDLIAGLTAEEIDVIYIRSGLVKRLSGISSGDNVIDCSNFNNSLYSLDDKTQSILRSLTHILPGGEASVTFSDELAEALGIAKNDYKKRFARRNKFIMHKSVADAGLRVPFQAICADFKEFITWKERHSVAYPVIVKPVDAAGTQDVSKCYSDDDVMKALSVIIGKRSVFEKYNNEALIQEFVDGHEYLVNSVSSGMGRHIVTDIWVYEKGIHNGAAFVYEKARLLPSKGEIQDTLIEYSSKCLDALGYIFGPSHMEIIVNAQGDPILIEVGARLPAARLYCDARAAIEDGVDQIQMTAKVIKGEKVDEKRRYQLSRKAVVCFMISDHDGIVTDHKDISVIRNLKSFNSLQMLQQGEIIKTTVDLFSHPGEVHLVHENAEQLAADLAFVEQYTAPGFFTVQKQ